MDDEMLPREDPKVALAKVNFEGHIDVNEASFQELIRVPGIGLISAKRLMARKEKVKKYEELRTMGVNVNRAKPFIKLDGKKQMSLAGY